MIANIQVQQQAHVQHLRTDMCPACRAVPVGPNVSCDPEPDRARARPTQHAPPRRAPSTVQRTETKKY